MILKIEFQVELNEEHDIDIDEYLDDIPLPNEYRWDSLDYTIVS